ncbi:MAG: mechanosensitive ion channel family protein [Candidatus Thorarchaeota archaeon]
MQFDLFQEFVNIIGDFLNPFGLETYAIFVAIIPFLAVIYISYLIAVRAVKISFRKAGISREASSGVIFGVRLVFFAIALIAILTLTNAIAGSGVVAIGALLGTAIGLAFSQAMSNLLGGFYVLGARPFRVGDYVVIGDAEGLVIEITLNYTRLLQKNHTRMNVPNSKVVTSTVKNFRVRADDYIAERELEVEEDMNPRKSKRLDFAVSTLRSLTKGEEIYRRTFDVNVNINFDSIKVRARFDDLCEEFSSHFVEKPEYIFSYNQLYGITYSFAYIVKNPKRILFEGLEFEQAVAEAIMHLT